MGPNVLPHQVLLLTRAWCIDGGTAAATLERVWYRMQMTRSQGLEAARKTVVVYYLSRMMGGTEEVKIWSIYEGIDLGTGFRVCACELAL